MNTNIYCILLLSLVLGFFSCKPEKITPEPCSELSPCVEYPPDTKLDTLWTYQFGGENWTGTPQNMEIYKNKLIVAFDKISQDLSIRCFDVENRGNLLWRNVFPNGALSTKVLQEQGLLYNKSRTRRQLIDIEGGQVLQDVKSTSYTGPRGFFGGDDLYFEELSNVWGDDSVWIYRTNYKDLNKKELIYTLTKDYAPNGMKSIESANLWINPLSGDSILIFQHRMSLDNRVDVIAWNMSRKTFEWKHDDLTKLGNSGIAQFMLIDNKAYFLGGTAFYCFDMFAGDILWQFDHPSGINSLLFHKPVYIESSNRIILKDDSVNLYAFDADSGAIIWVNTDAGYSSIITGSPKYYNGIIYYAAFGSLHAVRAEDGKTLWAEKSVYDYQSEYIGEIAIDPERGCLYVSNKKSIVAVKLYEE